MTGWESAEDGKGVRRSRVFVRTALAAAAVSLTAAASSESLAAASLATARCSDASDAARLAAAYKQKYAGSRPPFVAQVVVRGVFQEGKVEWWRGRQEVGKMCIEQTGRTRSRGK